MACKVKDLQLNSEIKTYQKSKKIGECLKIRNILYNISNNAITKNQSLTEKNYFSVEKKGDDTLNNIEKPRIMEY